MFNAAILDMMTRLTPRYMKGLTTVPLGGNDLFALAIRGLAAPELPLKSSAAHFWVWSNI